MDREAEPREFVAARGAALSRAAYLLTGDHQAAVDPGPPGLVHVSAGTGATSQVRTMQSDVDRNYADGPLAMSTLPEEWQTWPAA